MGYNTRYSIEAATDADGPDAVERFIAALHKASDYDAAAFRGQERVKWYEHERDIVRLMLATETLAVDLHGEGEAQGDVWDKEFRLVTVHGHPGGELVEVTVYKYELRRPDRPTETKRLR